MNSKAAIIEKRKTELLREVLKKDYSRLDIWFELATEYEKEKNYENAIESYQNILARKDDFDSDIYQKLGFCYSMQGEYKKASKIFMEQEIIYNHNLIKSKRYKTSKAFERKVNYTEYYERLEVKENIILFESFSGENFSDNSYAIFKAMKADIRFKEWIFIWVLNDKAKMPKEYLSDEKTILINRHTNLYLRYLATAKVLVSNAVLPVYFIKKNNQIYINTWHGTPWKYLGLDNPYQNGNTARNFIQADFLISPNPHTSDILLNRYGINGYFQGELLEIGYPRIDSMLNMTRKGKELILNKLGIIDDKPIVLYAPTYKGLWSNPDIEADEIIEYLDTMKSDDYHLLFRGHYFVESKLENIDIEGVIIADHSIDSCELLSVVDTLITDYSSIMFDYLPMNKPIVIFALDYEKYKEDRGLYLDKDNVPGYFVDNLNNLKSSIERVVFSPEEFVNNQIKYKEIYSLYEDGKASDRLIDTLERKLNNETEVSNIKDNATTVLVYPGIIEEEKDIDLIEDYIKEKRKKSVNTKFCLLFNKAELVTNKKILCRVEKIEGIEGLMEYSGAPVYLLEENWLVNKVNTEYINLNYNNEHIYEKYYTREFKRLFGKRQFDEVKVLKEDNELITHTFKYYHKDNIKKEFL